MQVASSLSELPAGLRLVATVGIFDGVHRGHAVVLRTLVGAARDRDAESVIVTFEPHPETVLRGTTPLLLCDPAERLERFAGAGVSWTVTHPFDRAFSSLTPAEFLGLVRDRRDLSALVMTPESAFGRDRAGTAAAVARLGTELGFEVLQQPPLEIGRGRISSTRIREHIEAGRLREAGRLLGRPYAVVGEIVQGDRRGRELGYPTANFRFPAPVALPPNGVYAARVGWGDDSLLHPARTADGVASLGVRPTFGEGSRLLEAHLFDIDEDLYGQRMRLEFVRRQRGEQRFRDAGSLVTQMHRDAARARTLLGERSSARAGTLPRL